MPNTFTPDRAGIYFTTRSIQGPVGRDLTRRVSRVRVIAGATSPFRTGRLKATHSSSVRETATGLFGDVTAAPRKVGPWKGDPSYAMYVHEGTRGRDPVIRPVRAKALRFRWGSQVVFCKRVNKHPGNAGQPWLRNALRGAVG